MSYPPTDATPSMGLRAMPSSPDAERAILALMLEYPGEVVPRAWKADSLFYVPAHKVLHEAIRDLCNRGQLFTFVELMDILNTSDRMAKVGGPKTVAELAAFQMENAGPIALLDTYLEQVRNAAKLRSVIQACNALVMDAFDSQLSKADEVLDKAETSILGIREGETSAGDPKEWRVAVREHIVDLEKRWKDGDPVGLSTGFEKLDEMTGGLISSEYWVVAARPSMGKTSFAMQVAQTVAASYPVLVFSAEMTTGGLVNRSLSGRSRIENRRLASGKMSKTEFTRLHETVKDVQSLKLWVDDESNIEIGRLRSKARRLNREVDLRLIVVDYLQLLTNVGKFRSREEEVSAISKDCKRLAKELNCTVMVCAQLNRDVEKRSGGRPRKSDLRESGGIEQDADVIGFLCAAPDEAGNIPGAEDLKESTVLDALFIVDKVRNGATGDVPLVFYKDQTQFVAPK